MISEEDGPDGREYVRQTFAPKVPSDPVFVDNRINILGEEYKSDYHHADMCEYNGNIITCTSVAKLTLRALRHLMGHV